MIQARFGLTRRPFDKSIATGDLYRWPGLDELDARLQMAKAARGIILPPRAINQVLRTPPAGGESFQVSIGDATVKFWDLAGVLAGDPRRVLRRQPDAVTSLVLAKGDRVVVTGHENRSLVPDVVESLGPVCELLLEHQSVGHVNDAPGALISGDPVANFQHAELE